MYKCRRSAASNGFMMKGASASYRGGRGGGRGGAPGANVMQSRAAAVPS